MTRRSNLVLGWTAALIVIAAFVRLGLWQSARAVDKQRMVEATTRVLSMRVPVPLVQATTPSQSLSHDWSAGTGEFDAGNALLLDNQQRGGRAGVRVYRIFKPEQADASLLVDLGWLPLPLDRALPVIAPVPGRIALRGLLAPPPSSGLALGPSLERKGDAWLLSRVDLGDIAARTGMSAPLAPRVLRLDPDMPIGYARDLALLVNTLPPDKHRGYALQWFALAIAVFVTALVMSRPRRSA